MFLRVTLLLSVAFLGVQQSSAATDKVVCFYSSWADYRNGPGTFAPENIDPTLCTHIIYAFLGVNTDGSLSILDEWNEVDKGGLQHFASLKIQNPSAKFLVSIGGWNAGSTLLTGVVASSTLRNNFIASNLAFFRQWGFDGLDIAWEFPQSIDRANYVTLLTEIQTAFRANNYVLSVTISANPTEGYDIARISSAVDLINLMTYDYYTAYDGLTGHNSALYSNDERSVSASLSKWIAEGINLSKTTISIPLYGHSFSLSDSRVNGLGSPANPGIAGPYTQSPGTVGYNEICSLYGDWEKYWDDDAKTGYIVNQNDWISYEDPLSISFKVTFAKTNGLAGLAVWSIDTDDFLGNCGDKFGLLRAINEHL